MTGIRTAEEWEVIARQAMDELYAAVAWGNGMEKYNARLIIERDTLRDRVRELESNEIPGHASGGVPAGDAPEGRDLPPAPGAHPLLVLAISGFAVIGVAVAVGSFAHYLAGVIA